MSEGSRRANVAELLRSRYALTDVHLERVLGGQSTRNYRVYSSGRDLFVKVFPADTRGEDEHEAIAWTRFAGDHGVPTARVVESREGDVLARSGLTTVSVWEWIEGRTETRGLTHPQQAVAGRTLGRIHNVFSHHPWSRGASPWFQEWFSLDLDGIRSSVEFLLKLIEDRDRHLAFDSLAHATLTERLEMLQEVPGLLSGVPRDLTTQVLHGDYTAPNLLFDGNHLAAVIDFRPPVPYMLSWELGRIAFDPRTVALDEEWIDSAATLIRAYLEANPGITRPDVLTCGRVILIQMLTSLYGVEQHYLAPGLLQDDLDRFWELRHRAVSRLFRNLTTVETMLHEVAEDSPTP